MRHIDLNSQKVNQTLNVCFRQARKFSNCVVWENKQIRNLDRSARSSNELALKVLWEQNYSILLFVCISFGLVIDLNST